MDLGPHQKVFVVETSVRDGNAVAVERTRAGAVWEAERPAARRLVVTRRSGALRFKETVGGMLKGCARLLYLSPVLLVVAPIASWIYKPAAAFVLALFVCVVVLFFATFDLFIVASLIAWARRGRGARPVFTLPSFSEVATAPAFSRELVGKTVHCVGRATLLTTGMEPVIRAAWWTDERATELVLCSTFAVVPDEGTPVVVRHLRAPRLVAGPSSSVSAEERLAIADVRAEPHDAALVVHEGDRVEVEGTVAELIDNAAHFQIDGVTTGLPSPDTREDDPYRDAPGAPALLVDDGVVIRKVG